MVGELGRLVRVSLAATMRYRGLPGLSGHYKHWPSLGDCDDQHVARLRLALCQGVAVGRRDRFGQHRYPLCDPAATGLEKVELPARSSLVVASLNDSFRLAFLNGRGVTYGGGRVGDDDGRGCKTAFGGRR